MKLKELRYAYEHQLLPQWYFQDKEPFVATLASDKQNVPFMLLKNLCADNNIEMSYKEKDFKIELYQIVEDIKMAILHMPKPESMPLCHRIYFIFNDSFDKMSYFTVEQSLGNTNALCAWDKEGTHLNYGECPTDNDKEQLKVIELYMSQFYKK